jgi:hypothetical protein
VLVVHDTSTGIVSKLGRVLNSVSCIKRVLVLPYQLLGSCFELFFGSCQIPSLSTHEVAF